MVNVLVAKTTRALIVSSLNDFPVSVWHVTPAPCCACTSSYEPIWYHLLGWETLHVWRGEIISYVEFQPDFLFSMLPFIELLGELDASISGPPGFLLCESHTLYCLLTSCRLAAGFQFTLLCWVSYHLPVCFPSSKTFLTFLISSVAFVGLFLYSFRGLYRRVKIRNLFKFLLFNWKSWSIVSFLSFIISMSSMPS